MTLAYILCGIAIAIAVVGAVMDSKGGAYIVALAVAGAGILAWMLLAYPPAAA